LARKVLTVAAQNANALVFLVGLGLAYVGVCAVWSVGAANVAAGVVLMGIGALPYLRIRKG